VVRLQRLKLELLALISGTLLLLGLTPASATFIVSDTDAGLQLHNGAAYSNVSTFTAGFQTLTGVSVTVDTVGNVDTGAGFATIKPENETPSTPLLTSVTFTPSIDSLLNGFSFRGQLTGTGTAPFTVDLQVTDQLGILQTFAFTVAGLNQDFGPFGIVSTDGDTIKSVELLFPPESTWSFKSVKQIEFADPPSFAGPEPTTLSLLGVGLVGLGIAARRKRRAGRWGQA
jgi:hypothetical protein